MDPCASRDKRFWIADVNKVGPEGTDEDGLDCTWKYGPAFVNPPFSKLKKWSRKCARENRLRDTEIILLAPARTDTIAFHVYQATAALICLWKGRIWFEGAEQGCPFPILFAYWGLRSVMFREVFRPYGMIFRPPN